MGKFPQKSGKQNEQNESTKNKWKIPQRKRRDQNHKSSSTNTTEDTPKATKISEEHQKQTTNNQKSDENEGDLTNPRCHWKRTTQKRLTATTNL